MAQAQPKNPTVQCELGQTLRQKGDLLAAAAAFERALEIDPEMREAYYGLGFTLKQQAAARHKAPHASLAPNQYHKQAQDDLAKGDLSSAKEQLLKALATDENDGDAHNLLGFHLRSTRRHDFGTAAFGTRRRPSARLCRHSFNYGAALWYSGAKQKAISELNADIRLDPSAAANYALLGMAQRDEGDILAGAKLNLERALALSPATAASFIDLGIVFLKQAELQRALAQFEAGLNANSSVPLPIGMVRSVPSVNLFQKVPISQNRTTCSVFCLDAEAPTATKFLASSVKLCIYVQIMPRLTTTWA